MTKGEYRVGINFNPSSSDTVYKIKSAAAGLIDLIEEVEPEFCSEEELFDYYLESKTATEIARLKALAQTCIEEGAMWAVKAATKLRSQG